MNDFLNSFDRNFRQKPRYAGSREPAETRLPRQVATRATEQHELAKRGEEAIHKPWHVKLPDGSFECCVRLNNKRIHLGQGNSRIVPDHAALLEHYEKLIQAIENGDMDQQIFETAVTIKSMKREAMPILKARFPDSCAITDLQTNG